MRVRKSILWVWAVFNILVGMYELYVYEYKKKLKLNYSSIWNKSHHTNKNIFIEIWNEYCKVDSRYINKHYVWIFELLNAGLSILFIIALIINKKIVIKNILFLQIINCFLYFFTLLFEIMYSKSFVKNIKTYAKIWMIPMYYGISMIWIFIPYYLYKMI